jgi:hypothetical protein
MGTMAATSIQEGQRRLVQHLTWHLHWMFTRFSAARRAQRAAAQG